MTEPDDDRSTLVYALQTLAPIREEIERYPRGTIKPGDPTADELGRAAIASLMEAAQRDRTVTLGSTLGQGGMGIVHLAEQVALARTVAVKRLRPEHVAESHVLSLMREAWVTGGLEHPNIVPVHDVGLDADRRPFLVMKRIEGEEWGTLLADREAVVQRFSVQDVEAWHLGVLVQVCNAVAFAHSRGIIHRDLKPENVMIGGFGEVYLLDWGIALALEPDPSGRLPSVRTGNVAGTPAYMAPEMLGQGELGPWTDVYLLGGLLYGLLAGRAPHVGGKLEALIASIQRSEVVRPTGSPELVELAMQALSRDPASRPPSAEAFRLRLVRHLEHRGALALSSEAALALARLEEKLALDGAESDDLWHDFGEARFGFRQALRSWPEHTPSREGLDRAVTQMVRYELDRDDPHSAARLLAEDRVVDAALDAAVREAEERAARRARDSDSTLGQRTRFFVAVVLALLWTAFPLVTWWLGRAPEHRFNLVADAVFAALILGAGVWARDSLTKTALNRTTWSVLFLIPLSDIALGWALVQLGLDAAQTQPIHLFAWTLVATLVTLTLERRFWPTALAYMGAFVGSVGAVDYSMFLVGLANLVLAANVSAIWWPGPPNPAAVSSRSDQRPEALPAPPDAAG